MVFSEMRAFAFVRWNNPIGGIDVGHIGWGFELQDGTFACGSTENITGAAYVAPGENNYAWLKLLPDKTAMLSEMCRGHCAHSNRYHAYKWVEVSQAHPNEAMAIGNANAGRGFWIPRNDCLDHVGFVLEAYGVPWKNLAGSPKWGLPSKQLNPTPNGWFRAWRVELENLP